MIMGCAKLMSSGEKGFLRAEATQMGYMWQQGSGDRPYWTAVQMLHPKALAIVSFSPPGFNAARDESIVSFRAKTADEQESQETVFLRRSSSGWIVEKRHLENQPISGAIAADVCVPVTPGTPPVREELSTLSGDYDFTLVSSAVDNRILPFRLRFLPDTLMQRRPREAVARNPQLSSQLDVLPVFEVIDVRTGSRAPRWEPGTNLESAGAYFMNASYTAQPPRIRVQPRDPWHLR